MCQKCTHATVHIISEANEIHIIANHRYHSTFGPEDTKKDNEGKQNETKDRKLHSNQEGGLFSKPAARNKVAHVRRRSSATFTTYQQVAVTGPGRHRSKNVLIESNACFSRPRESEIPSGRQLVDLSVKRNVSPMQKKSEMAAIQVDATASQCPLRHSIFDSINCVTSFDAGFQSEVRRNAGRPLT